MSNRREQLEADISAYLDNELPEKQRGRIEALLARDPAARALLADLQAMRAALGSLPRAGASADMMEAIRARMERQALLGDSPAASRRAEKARLSASRWAAAAVIVLMTSAGGYFIWNLNTTANLTTPNQQLAALDDGAAERRSRGASEASLENAEGKSSHGGETVADATEGAAKREAPLSIAAREGQSSEKITLFGMEPPPAVAAESSADVNQPGDPAEQLDLTPLDADDAATTSVRMAPPADSEAAPAGRAPQRLGPRTFGQELALEKPSPAQPGDVAGPDVAFFGRAAVHPESADQIGGDLVSRGALLSRESSADASTQVVTVVCADLDSKQRLLEHVSAGALSVQPVDEFFGHRGARREEQPTPSAMPALSSPGAEPQPSQAPARAPAAAAVPHSERRASSETQQSETPASPAATATESITDASSEAAISAEAIGAPDASTEPREQITDLIVMVADEDTRQRMLARLDVHTSSLDSAEVRDGDVVRDRDGDLEEERDGVFGTFMSKSDRSSATQPARPAEVNGGTGGSWFGAMARGDSAEGQTASSDHRVRYRHYWDVEAGAFKESRAGSSLGANALFDDHFATGSAPLHVVRLHIRVQDAADRPAAAAGSPPTAETRTAQTLPAPATPPFDPSVLDLGSPKRTPVPPASRPTSQP